MAIGLGNMMGFSLTENFNYPYISKSIQEFWNRWHISLSTWFRDYIFYPMEKKRNYGLWAFLNIFIVFALCGLWHGSTWNFVIWGMYYGVFLGLERIFLGKYLEKLWLPLRHFYSLIVIMCGWVIFKTSSLIFAGEYLKAMFGFGRKSLNPENLFILQSNLNIEIYLIFAIGIIFSFDISKLFNKIINKIEYVNTIFMLIKILLLIIIFVISLSYLSSKTYTQFLYFKF
jgi:alginate O-acetyltransferase complex protein AlgI